MATLWPLSHQVQVDLNGSLAARAKAFFYDAGTTTPRTVYTDSALSVPHAHPVVADGTGRFPAIFLAFGDFKHRVTDEGGAVLFEVDGVSNTDPASGPGGGGGGGDVAGWNTGDFDWQPYLIARTGWVVSNSKTIGSATSGATGRANADTQPLFEFLWNNFANTACPVSGGRGVSATADFLANKTIATLDMRARGGIGMDDMGSSASNRLQVSTTIDTTNASATATVASASRVGIGMYVLSANVPAGTTVTDVNGTTVTLSANATATGTSIDARFSYFLDPQAAAQPAGKAEVALALGELAAHDHGGVTGSTLDQQQYKKYQSANGGSSAGSTYPLVGSETDSNTTATAHTHTIASAGRGLPHANLPPVMTGAWYARL